MEVSSFSSAITQQRAEAHADIAHEKPNKPGERRGWKTVATVAGCTVAGAVALPWAIPAVVTALGFGLGGIGPGTLATSIMASYGGAVTAGSACAVMQSIGAAGLSAGVTAAAAGAGGATAATGAFLATKKKSVSKI
ncbi:hypothetical protein DFJ77DRAFT_479296 [Powellomyces hirtus]|nr:hypothetical protein DFJ77DRAFT_479296 [Powellomyces hirtus]